MSPLKNTPITVLVAQQGKDHTECSSLSIRYGQTVGDLLSQIRADQPLEKGDFGVWGVRCELDRILEEGDRLEIYRDIQVDPKEARRLRAQMKETQEPLRARRHAKN